MMLIALRILMSRLFRTVTTIIGLSALFFLSIAQVGMLIGWCHTTSAIVRHAGVDVWVMAEKTAAFDYGTAIPRQRVYQSRAVEGVASADALFMAWNTWQRPDGSRVNIELVGLDANCRGGPWSMVSGCVDDVHLPHAVIVDELFLNDLGVQQTGDEVELYGRRAVVRGISAGVRTFTASPFVFTSLSSAVRYDRRYNDDEVTFVLIRCHPGHSAEAVRDRLRTALSSVEVLTTSEFASRTIRYWMLETGIGITVILTAVLGFTVSLVIITQTLYALISEHLSDYATLLAIGFLPRQLIRCVMLQTSVLVGSGISIGTCCFWIAAMLSSRTPLPLEMTQFIFCLIILVSAAFATGATVFAMRPLFRLDPVLVFRG